MQLPFVSLVIPTYNRGDILCDTVNHLLREDYPRYEIIVVDQTEKVPGSVEEFFAHLDSGKVRYIHIDQVGLPNARNLGIREAKGEVILFIDDDVQPAPGFVESHARNFGDPSVLGVSGRVLDHTEERVQTDPRQVLRIKPWGQITGGKNYTQRIEVDYLAGPNFSFRRDIALRAGLFERLILGSAQGEDVEFSLRLKRMCRGRFIFDPKAELVHLSIPTGGCSTRYLCQEERHFWRFYNRGLIASRNRHRFNFGLYLLFTVFHTCQLACKHRNPKLLRLLFSAAVWGIEADRTGDIPEQLRACTRRLNFNWKY